MNIEEHINSLPKADVHNHLHLGGAPNLLYANYPNSNIKIPGVYDGLDGMIDFIYNQLNTIMCDGPQVKTFMHMAVQSAIADNVSLLEASVDLNLTRFFDDSLITLLDIVAQLKDTFKDQVKFNPDLGINKDLPIEQVYKNGIICLESGLFNGVDIYGKEDGRDLTPFVKLFDKARDLGITTKAHIGEFSDPKTIEDAITQLNPDQLQHGIRAVESERTMDLILERDLRLNVCPQSNLALGAVKDLKMHPMRKLYDHGIRVTTNTDDLILFNKTVSEQMIDLVEQGVFTLEEIEKINGFAF